jgi:hypothetical protein
MPTHFASPLFAFSPFPLLIVFLLHLFMHVLKRILFSNTNDDVPFKLANCVSYTL